MRLQDETRAKLAAEAKEKYAGAGVAQVLDAEAKNLDVLLEESLKVVQENRKLQLDLALLDIAISHKPMASTMGEAKERLAALGYPDENLQALQTLAESMEGQAVDQRAIKLFGDALRRITGAAPPSCVLDTEPPSLAEWTKKTGAKPDAAGVATNFANYVRFCNRFRDKLKTKPSDGLLKSVSAAIDRERAEKKTRADVAGTAKKALDQARAEYKTVVDTSAGRLANCDKAEQGMAEGAAQKHAALKQALIAADKVNLELANNERIQQLLVLLEAAAGGEVNPSDGSIKAAASIAQEFPALWGDMCDLMAKSKTPPVGNLLLALGHATLLVEHARNQEAFADKRIAFLEQKQSYLRDEAIQWLRFLHAFCSYAMLPGGKDPGVDCIQFQVSDDGKNCQIPGSAMVAGCALSKRWSENVRSPGSALQTREMYKLLLAYQRAYALQARADEIDFRLVDLVHRETLERKRLAVKDWDNLVSGAVSQLDAYYSAGLKPAEVADLIVKAVGFIALAIGIAQ